ncbi:hypothetical protein DFH09DRAFT_1074156 [Mycena vulgaris]|nr:hypothetical protein DFH09DRAFT_1074156 [Mycena vulgaris]
MFRTRKSSNFGLATFPENPWQKLHGEGQDKACRWRRLRPVFEELGQAQRALTPGISCGVPPCRLGGGLSNEFTEFTGFTEFTVNSVNFLIHPRLRVISFIAALLFIFILSKSYLTPHSLKTTIGMTFGLTAPAEPTWTSRYEDWYSRTEAHPSPASFTPTLASLSLAVLRNTPVEPEGFTLALFDAGGEKVAVDAMGRVLLVPDADYTPIVDLARRMALELPETGTFRNTWVLKHAATSQPIDRLLVVVDGGLKETSVQGFVKGKTELKTPVEDIAALPGLLNEVAGLVLEGRTGYSRGSGDTAMVQKVKDILSASDVLL